MSSSEVNCTNPDVTDTPTTHDLCDTVLELAAMHQPRLSSAQRIAQALERTMPLMNPAQKKIARERIAGLETKWGPMLYGASSAQHATGEISQKIAPEKVIAAWLIRRKSPERVLRVICRAVNFMQSGRYRLNEIADKAYEKETDHVLIPVSYQSFKEWMLELRIGSPVRSEGKVEWERGEWFDVWIEVGKQVGIVEGMGSMPVGSEGSAPKENSVQTPSYEGDDPPVGAKKAAVVPGTKQKVGEGLKKGGGPHHGTVLGKIRYQMAVIRADRSRRAARAQKKSQTKWTTARRAAREKALVSGV